MNNTIRSFFDRLASGWGNLLTQDEYSVIEEMEKQLNGFEDKTYLDIGCGTGVLSKILLDKNALSIKAIDISENMIEKAQKQLLDKRVSFVVEDICEISSTQTFDVAIIFNAYPHMFDKQAVGKCVASVLKPNGVFLIAHSHGRQFINCTHSGSASPVSTPLLSTMDEFNKLSQFFTLKAEFDNTDFYLLSLVKK